MLRNTIFNAAQWISVPLPVSGIRKEAIYLRYRFEVPKALRTAKLVFSALGVAEPWINGQRVGADYFTPGWSDFRKRAYSIDYDVLSLLQSGWNAMGFILGDGWAGAPFGPSGHAVAFAPQTMLAAELHLEDEAGDSTCIGTGQDWVWRSGPILKQSIYHGETYDARRDLPDWGTCESSQRGWKAVECPEAPRITITPKKCPPVRVTETLEPVSIKKTGAGSVLCDFGQNLVGVASLRMRNTRSGQRVTIRFAEMLNENGDLYIENLRSAEATDTYICRGAKEESYTPRFTYHGFRYAYVQGLSHAIRSGDITASALHNDLKPIGDFRFSSSDVNQLQSCVRWGQRGNFIEAPTDCPQRDERLGWSGDAQVFVETACYNYDCEGFYRQWMDAMRDGQRADGAFPDVAPDILGWHGRSGWADAGIIVPEAVWRHTGRTAIIEENWEAMERYMAFLEARSVKGIQPDEGYGDWLAVDAVKPGWGPTPKDLIATALHVHVAQLMERMAKVQGKKAAVRHYRKIANGVRRAFNRRFVTDDGLVLGDTQASYLFALAYDLLPERLIDIATRRLVDRIADREWHLSTGFLGTPLLNPVLTKAGRSDVAYRLLLQDSYPSWLYPVRNGATTMWERWNSWTPESGFGPVEMNSFNHYAYGAIGQWLYASVVGISPDPDFPGYQRVRIAPRPGPGLKSASGRLITPQGHVACSWRLKGVHLIINLVIPAGVIAKVSLDVEDANGVRLGGLALGKSAHTMASEDGRGGVLIEVGEGRHLLEVMEYHPR